MFVLIGILILYLAKSGKLAMSGDYQLSVNIFMANMTSSINSFFTKKTSIVWIGVLIALIILTGAILLNKRKKAKIHENK